MNESSAPSTPAARRKARRFALQALYGWQLSGNDVREIEVQYLRDNDMHKVDRGYFHDLLFGVVEQAEALDAALADCLDRAPAELTQVEKAILRRIGAAQAKRITPPFQPSTRILWQLSSISAQ